MIYLYAGLGMAMLLPILVGLQSAVNVAELEQGELAIRIDEHMDETVANVESAQAHLLKYLQRISSNRWLVMKIFAVLLVWLVRCGAPACGRGGRWAFFALYTLACC